MTQQNDLVLDANILVRGALGIRVSRLLSRFEKSTGFFTPELCFADAQRHISALAARRNLDANIAFRRLEVLEGVVSVVRSADYESQMERAMARIRSRDASDWPIVATSLLLDAPLWTEDRDFFGCGVATWTTKTVELYLRGR